MAVVKEVAHMRRCEGCGAGARWQRRCHEHPVGFPQQGKHQLPSPPPLVHLAPNALCSRLRADQLPCP